MQLLSKGDGSSLSYDVIIRIKILKIDKFDYFSSDIDFNRKTDIFRDVISLIINQCDSRRPKGASGGYEVFASRAAQQAKRACIYININRVLIVRMIYIYIRISIAF